MRHFLFLIADKKNLKENSNTDLSTYSENKRFNYHRRSIHVMPRFNSAVANSLESASTSSSNSSSSNTLSQTSE